MTQPQPLYKPKKGGETDPKLAAKVDIGLKYLDEFATPDGGAAAEEGVGSKKRGETCNNSQHLLIPDRSSGI